MATPTRPSDPRKTTVEPITLDQLVQRVLVASGGRGTARGGGLGSRIRGVFSGRGSAADADPASGHADTGLGPARVSWGLAPTEPVCRLMGVPAASAVGWVPSLKLSPVVAAANPPATLCALRGAREAQAAGLRAAASAGAQADRVREIGLRAWVLHDLIRAFPEQEARLLEVAEVTPPSLHRALEQVPQQIVTARNTSVRVFEGPLARRVDAALALLASPTIRGAVPEAPALRPRAIRLAKVAADLAAVAPRVETLHRRRERLQTLRRLGELISGRPEMSRLLRWEDERLRGALSELDRRAGALVYPEAGADGWPAQTPVETGDPVIDGVYALNAEEIDVEACDPDPLEAGLIDRLQDLNLRVLTDLAALTDRVERGLELVGRPRRRRSVA